MLNINIQRRPNSIAYGQKAASFQPYATLFGRLCKLNNTKNNIHPNIKFTISHTTKNNLKCDFCESNSDAIPFLDTQCKIQNKKIIVDLYKKPTDRNQYLLTSSCHPNSVTNNIPFSLTLRIVRLCSEERLSEL